MSESKSPVKCYDLQVLKRVGLSICNSLTEEDFPSHLRELYGFPGMRQEARLPIPSKFGTKPVGPRAAAASQSGASSSGSVSSNAPVSTSSSSAQGASSESGGTSLLKGLLGIRPASATPPPPPPSGSGAMPAPATVQDTHTTRQHPSVASGSTAAGGRQQSAARDTFSDERKEERRSKAVKQGAGGPGLGGGGGGRGQSEADRQREIFEREREEITAKRQSNRQSSAAAVAAAKAVEQKYLGGEPIVRYHDECDNLLASMIAEETGQPVKKAVPVTPMSPEPAQSPNDLGGGLLASDDLSLSLPATKYITAAQFLKSANASQPVLKSEAPLMAHDDLDFFLGSQDLTDTTFSGSKPRNASRLTSFLDIPAVPSTQSTATSSTWSLNWSDNLGLGDTGNLMFGSALDPTPTRSLFDSSSLASFAQNDSDADLLISSLQIQMPKFEYEEEVLASRSIPSSLSPSMPPALSPASSLTSLGSAISITKLFSDAKAANSDGIVSSSQRPMGDTLLTSTTEAFGGEGSSGGATTSVFAKLGLQQCAPSPDRPVRPTSATAEPDFNTPSKSGPSTASHFAFHDSASKSAPSSASKKPTRNVMSASSRMQLMQLKTAGSAKKKPEGGDAAAPVSKESESPQSTLVRLAAAVQPPQPPAPAPAPAPLLVAKPVAPVSQQQHHQQQQQRHQYQQQQQQYGQQQQQQQQQYGQQQHRTSSAATSSAPVPTASSAAHSAVATSNDSTGSSGPLRMQRLEVSALFSKPAKVV